MAQERRRDPKEVVKSTLLEMIGIEVGGKIVADLG